MLRSRLLRAVLGAAFAGIGGIGGPPVPAMTPKEIIFGAACAHPGENLLQRSWRRRWEAACTAKRNRCWKKARTRDQIERLGGRFA